MYLHRIVIWHRPASLPMEIYNPLHLMPVTSKAHRVAFEPLSGLHRWRIDAGTHACSNIRTIPSKDCSNDLMYNLLPLSNTRDGKKASRSSSFS